MLLHGAFVPPQTVLEEVAAVVRSVAPPAQEAQPAKGLFSRLAHRKDEASAPVDGPALLDGFPIDTMSLPITAFGNVTPSDVQAIVAAISAAAAGWSPPTVRFSGGTALDFPGDWKVWARLTGEVEALAAIARGVTQAVEPLGFFVDRRAYRPVLAVAKVTTATTGPYLEALVAALEAFEGTEWGVGEIVLTTIAPGARDSAFAEYLRIPLSA